MCVCWVLLLDIVRKKLGLAISLAIISQPPLLNDAIIGDVIPGAYHSKESTMENKWAAIVHGIYTALVQRYSSELWDPLSMQENQ